MIEANWSDDTTIGTVTTDGDNEWMTLLLTLVGPEARTFYRCEVTPLP